MQELNKIEETLEEVTTESSPTEISIEQLPVHVLREKLDNKGIRYKSTDKKATMVKALLTGQEVKKEVVKKVAPTLVGKETARALPVLSSQLKEELSKLEAQGLVYEIDEYDGCINFLGSMPTSANIDQPMNNILSAARESIRRPTYGRETSSTRDMI
jgi:hypothetical protein